MLSIGIRLNRQPFTILLQKFNIYLQINSLLQTVIGGSSSGNVILDEDCINLNRLLNYYYIMQYLEMILDSELSSCNCSANGKNPYTLNNTLIKCGDNDKEPESINVLESTEELLKNLMVNW